MHLRVALLDLSTGQVLLLSNQASHQTADEAFFVGQQGGDHLNELEGSLVGTLFPGHEYHLVYAAEIFASNSVTSPDTTATGFVSLTFVPEPTAAVLVGAGLAALGFSASERRTPS